MKNLKNSIAIVILTILCIGQYSHAYQFTVINRAPGQVKVVIPKTGESAIINANGSKLFNSGPVKANEALAVEFYEYGIIPLGLLKNYKKLLAKTTITGPRTVSFTLDVDNSRYDASDYAIINKTSMPVSVLLYISAFREIDSETINSFQRRELKPNERWDLNTFMYNAAYQVYFDINNDYGRRIQRPLAKGKWHEITIAEHNGNISIDITN